MLKTLFSKLYSALKCEELLLMVLRIPGASTSKGVREGDRRCSAVHTFCSDSVLRRSPPAVSLFYLFFFPRTLHYPPWYHFCCTSLFTKNLVNKFLSPLPPRLLQSQVLVLIPKQYQLMPALARLSPKDS